MKENENLNKLQYRLVTVQN